MGRSAEVKGRDTALRTVWKGLLGNPRMWAGSGGWELGLVDWHKGRSPKLWPVGGGPPWDSRRRSTWRSTGFKR